MGRIIVGTVCSQGPRGYKGGMLGVRDILALTPHYQKWVDQLLSQHAAAARPVTVSDFPRLGEFFNSITLEEARYVVVPKLPVIPFAQMGLPLPKGMEDVGGVTYRNTYFLLPGDMGKEAAHFHELVHVVQHKILGAGLYPMVYACEAFSKDYRSNFLEAIAYELQGGFEGGEGPFAVEPAVAARIGFRLPQLLNQLLKKL